VVGKTPASEHGIKSARRQLQSADGHTGIVVNRWPAAQLIAGEPE
jgi:hypothetical protein